jgi:hypothetical protein
VPEVPFEWDRSTAVLSIAVSRAAEIASGTAHVIVRTGLANCNTDAGLTDATLPIAIEQGLLKIDLSATSIDRDFWSTCSAEYTLIDHCGASHVVEFAVSFSAEGPRNFACLGPAGDGGTNDAGTVDSSTD